MRIPILVIAGLAGWFINPALGETGPSFEDREQIREWVAERQGFGTPQFQDLELGGTRFYIARFIPTSGLDFCHVYTLQELERSWSLVRYRTLPGGCALTIRTEGTQHIVYLGAEEVELDRFKPQLSVPPS